MKKPPLPSAPEMRIQTCTLQGLPELLLCFCVDPAAFLQRFDLTREDIQVRNHYIPYTRYAEILTTAAAECNAPHLGLLLSQTPAHARFSDGVLGILLKHCRHFGEVLDAIVRYHHAVSGGATYQLRKEGRTPYFTRHPHDEGFAESRVLQELSLCDFLHIFQKVLGPAWHPQGMFFTAPPPGDPTLYQERLDGPLHFNSERQAIQLAITDLDRSLHVPDRVIEELLEALGTDSREALEKSAIQATRQIIDILLPTGVCRAPSVAAAFGIHARTLHRRLHAEGTTFQEILTARRREQACAYLRHAAMSVKDVSNALGYAAPEVFVRAFRGWYGTTPGTWRDRD